MHPLAFKIKRVHHGVLAFGRQFLRGIEHATPARFDLLYALDQRHRRLHQGELLSELGIAPPTLSKMLKRLEELDLVVRKKENRDKRVKTVSLTARGKALIDRAMNAIFRWDLFQLIFECFFGFPPFETFFEVDNLHSTMSRLAHHLNDRATLSYPTDHPDD